MPLVAYKNMPVLNRLQEEGVEILAEQRAKTQDIRELHIGLLNMMPDGALKATERQFLRLIASSNRIAQFYVHIFTIKGVPRSPEMQSYIDENYEDFEELKKEGLDALIITGTNPTQPDLAKEPYVEELKQVFAWADNNVVSVLHSCLASHAAFKYFYNIERSPLEQKLFGIFNHRVMDRKHPLLSNINTSFDMPHSRKNDVSARILKAHGLRVLVEGWETGAALAVSPDGFRKVYLQGHPEYDVHSLLKEYKRDLKLYLTGKLAEPTPLPQNYFNRPAMLIYEKWRDNGSKIEEFPEEELKNVIDITWRDTAKAIFANWLGLVYELTHYDRQKFFMDGVNPEKPLERWWQ